MAVLCELYHPLSWLQPDGIIGGWSSAYDTSGMEGKADTQRPRRWPAGHSVDAAVCKRLEHA